MLNFSDDGLNYYLQVVLFWGSDGTDVQSTIDSNKNSSLLNPNNITELDIFTSLAYPFFHGSIIYRDERQMSMFKRMIDMPISYGHLHFAILNGSDNTGGDNIPKPVEGEEINENIFITGIDTYDDGQSEFVDVKIHFVAIDYLKFISNMKDVTTFNGFDETTKPLGRLLTDMFGSVGLGDRLDVDSVGMDVAIPYISTENDTLLTALDYVYRKIFDHNFKEHNGKTYCRLVYDFSTHKYVLWNFEDVGTRKSMESEEDNAITKARREIVPVNATVGSNEMNIDGRAYIKNCGDQSILFETMSNLKFVDYDYMENVFTDIDKTDNGVSFISHGDECCSNTMNANSIVFGNSQLFKENTYEKTFSTSRQNGSFYDMFTEAIFNTSFMRTESDGSIGRRPGTSVAVSFNLPDGTIYEHLSGTYLVTAIHSHYEFNGENRIFKSKMDLYRPYCTMDSVK